MWGMRGMTYFVKGKLYLAITNRSNTATSISVRGPGFVWGKDFIKLPRGDFEPTAEMLATAVQDASTFGVDCEEITFAGYGEPLLRYDTICEAAELIKDYHKDYHKAAVLRIKTNGLILSANRTDVASLLKKSGVDKMAIALQTDNATQYAEIMNPQEGGFDDVCAFVTACTAEGLEVDCTAVERPEVNLEGTRKLALSLGASSFTTSTWFP